MKNFIKENWMLLLSLLYIVSPFDFIPELLLGPIGIIDDTFIVIFLLAQALLRHLKRKKATGKQIIDGEII